MIKISAVILTRNEEIHIDRCLNSIKDIVDEIIIIDSGSTDKTIEISNKYENCKNYFNKWINYATQFNYGVNKTSFDWVLRIDADEIPNQELISSISTFKNTTNINCDCYYFDRHMTFLRGEVLYGGVFPSKVVRLFNKHTCSIEKRWMDEHIKTSGTYGFMAGKLIDDNKNNLTWWIEKHNNYANREALEFLLSKYKVNKVDTVAKFTIYKRDSLRRYLKENIYYKIPSGLRVLLYYFLYRMIINLGFLDSKKGRLFHYYQGYIYRNMVEAKIFEFEDMIAKNNNFNETAKTVLNIDL